MDCVQLMSIFGEVKATAALIRWADASGADVPWQLSKFSDGTPVFLFPGVMPSRAFVAPRRGRWVLVMAPSDAPDEMVERDVGGWNDPAGAVVHGVSVGLALRARELGEDRPHPAIDFALQSFQIAGAVRNRPAAVFAAEIAGDIIMSQEVFDGATRAYGAALEWLPAAGGPDWLRLRQKFELATFLARD